MDNNQAPKKRNKKMSGTRTHQERIDDSEHMDIDSGDESDGKSALRQVEAREEPKAAWRGPGNASMQHFHDPTATVDRSGQKHWEFQCWFCTWYVKFRKINHKIKA